MLENLVWITNLPKMLENSCKQYIFQVISGWFFLCLRTPFEIEWST